MYSNGLKHTAPEEEQEAEEEDEDESKAGLVAPRCEMQHTQGNRAVAQPGTIGLKHII